MVKIKKLDMLSVGKTMGVVFATLGLILGTILSFVVLKGITIIDLRLATQIILYGLGLTIATIICSGIIGFILGIMIALIYNKFSSKIFKIEADI